MLSAGHSAFAQQHPQPTCQDENGCEPDPPPPPSAPDCLDNATLGDSMIGRLSAAADGKVHVKYGFFDDLGKQITPSATVAAAFTAAFGEWNSNSSVTKVVFESVGVNDRPNVIVHLTDDPLANGGCASMNTASGFLNYSSQFASLTNTSPVLAAAGIKHELGHFLGLTDLPYSAGVNSISSQNGGSCLNPVVRTTSVQPADASTSTTCVSRAKSLASQSSDGGGGGDSTWIEYTPTCRVYYDVYDLWYWDDGWHFAGRAYVPFMTICE